MTRKSSKSKGKSLKSKKAFSHREFALYMLGAAVVGLFTLWAAFAAPHSGGGKGGGKPPKGGTSYTGSLSLKLLESTDGLAHWGQKYSFNVTTTAPYPFVEDDCYQNGVKIYAETNSTTLWPYSGVWMWDWANGGAADCTATLFYTDGTNTRVGDLATASFHVYP